MGAGQSCSLEGRYYFEALLRSPLAHRVREGAVDKTFHWTQTELASHLRWFPMCGSAHVHDPAFNARMVAETRALLSTVPA